jgi:cytidine deaminase
MKKYNLTKEDLNLIQSAREVSLKNRIEDKWLSCAIGATLITNSNQIYKGINIESKTSGPTSICGEMSAIAQMVSNNERKIKVIVSVYSEKKKFEVLQPCGSCRHIISQFGNPWVIISKSKKVRLLDIYPLPIKP